MGDKVKPEPLLGPWDDFAAGRRRATPEADQAGPGTDAAPEPFDVQGLARALKARNARARNAVKGPARRSRKKLGRVLARIMAQDPGGKDGE